MPNPFRNSALTLMALAMFATLTSAQNADQKSAHVDVQVIAPRAEDVGSLDGLIAAYYEVISGPAGQPRQWSRDRTLYIPDVRFVAMSLDKQGRPAAHVVSHQQFVDASNAELLAGFYENEIRRVTQRFGNIAHVLSTYESRLKANGPVIARGINSIEAFWDGKRWWIAAAIWDEQRPDNPLPVQYLPGGEATSSPKK